MVPAAFVVLDGAAADAQRQGRPRGAARARPAGSAGARPPCAPGRRSRRRWPASAAEVLRLRARSASTTTSSTSAATRSSASRSLARPRGRPRLTPRSCSSTRPSPSWPRVGRRPRAAPARREAAGRRPGAADARSSAGSSSTSCPSPHHFNQAAVARGRAPAPTAERLARGARGTWSTTTTRCASRFTASDEPGWTQQIGADDGAADPLRAGRSLGAARGRSGPTALEAVAARAAGEPRPRRGPLLRAVLFDLGRGPAGPAPAGGPPPGGRRRLLAHPARGPGDAASSSPGGEPPALPPKTTSFRRWAERLTSTPLERAARRGRLLAGRAPGAAVAPLPVDLGDGPRPRDRGRGRGRRGRARRRTRPGRCCTRCRGPTARRSTTLLLDRAGAGAAPAGRAAGAVLVDLEGHGREELFDDVDLLADRRLVHDALPGRCCELPAGTAPGAALKAVKEQLRAIPRRGIGYGLLRYLDAMPTIAERLRNAAAGREVRLQLPRPARPGAARRRPFALAASRPGRSQRRRRAAVAPAGGQRRRRRRPAAAAAGPTAPAAPPRARSRRWPTASSRRCGR